MTDLRGGVYEMFWGYIVGEGSSLIDMTDVLRIYYR